MDSCQLVIVGVIMSMIMIVIVLSASVAVGRLAAPSARRILGRRRIHTSAAALRLAVFDTLEEACIRVRAIDRGTVESQGRSIAVVLVLLIKAKFRLDSSTVNTEAMQTLPGTLGELHVLLSAV